MRGSKVIAQQRGVNVATTRSPIFTYLENIRRRRGMFEMAPEGQSGFLPPNRVIDNRMPDHLKARYFQGTADESFGRIASSDTFRQDAGTERYGMLHGGSFGSRKCSLFGACLHFRLFNGFWLEI